MASKMSTNEGGKNTTTTKTLLAMLAAGVLVTGAIFTVPPQQQQKQMAFASMHEEEVVVEEEEGEYVVDDEDYDNDDSNVSRGCIEQNTPEECQRFLNYEDGDFDDDGYPDEEEDCYENQSCDDKPDTWINWVKGNSFDSKEYVELDNGDITTSTRFIVDFQSYATDTGKGSHVDFKIDDGDYDAVASPHRFKILSPGEHMIYLKGVDKWGNEDETPAKFSFTIRGEKSGKTTTTTVPHKDIINKVEDSEDDVKRKVEDSENDVIRALSTKLNRLENTITDEHAVQDEELDDIQRDISKLKKGQKNLSADMQDQLEDLENRLLRAIDANEKALKAKIEDSESDVERKVEDSENDIIKQIQALWDWLRDLFASITRS